MQQIAGAPKSIYTIKLKSCKSWKKVVLEMMQELYKPFKSANESIPMGRPKVSEVQAFELSDDAQPNPHGCNAKVQRDLKKAQRGLSFYFLFYICNPLNTRGNDLKRMRVAQLVEHDFTGRGRGFESRLPLITNPLSKGFLLGARVVKLVDTQDLKSCNIASVPVRFRPLGTQVNVILVRLFLCSNFP